MAAKYLPLKVMEINEEYGLPFDKIISMLMKNNFPKMNEEQFIENLLELYFGTTKKEVDTLLNPLMKTFGEMLKDLGFLNERSLSDPQRILSDLYDMILKPTINDIWKKNKKVYKLDKDFCQALLKTENLHITEDMLNNLPYNHFYVDISDCDLFLPIEGMFVDLFDIEGGKALVVFLLSKDSFWSTYDFLRFSKEKEVDLTLKEMYQSQDILDLEYGYCDFNNKTEGKTKAIVEGNLNRAEADFFVYQLLTYMVSHEPQIEESAITKSTYRPLKPGGEIKNRFSEVQIFDVGTQFGKSFREQKRKYKCNTILTKHLEKQRKSPIPHFRSAHWQGYWVGKGRTQHIIKWIEPIFVNG